jgi:hypothetical protein
VERYIPSRSDACTQLLLREVYGAETGAISAPTLSTYGFSAYSQTDEDGILLYLFARLGVEHRVAVEICAGNGLECNAANLILNHGWHALLVDGDATNVQCGRAFYSQAPQTRIYPPVVANEWITRENVNAVVDRHGFVGEIDLLSLDLDGVDYWIWKALTVVNPRVVVLEYQDILGPDRSWTVPYSDSFSAAEFSMTDGVMPDFAGASLRAFVKLGATKGYRLVGVNRYGYNAFFVRSDLGASVLPEVEIGACFSHPKVRDGMRRRFPKVEHMPWVEV